jgi:hypothetical protein
MYETDKSTRPVMPGERKSLSSTEMRQRCHHGKTAGPLFKDRPEPTVLGACARASLAAPSPAAPSVQPPP